MKYADVIVDVSAPNLDKSFSYGIPEELTDQIRPGTAVIIPFGKGNTLKKGYVMGIRNNKPAGNFQIKNIDSVVKNSLAIDDEFMVIAGKMKERYGGKMKDALRTVIPVKRKIAVKKGVARKDAFPEISELVEQFPEGNGEFNTLNPEQEKAARKIIDDMADGLAKTYLLYGITGSGKTEVYINIIKNVLESGKQAIVLIPEISLTYQTVRRFALCFGKKVAFSHSKLSDGERYEMSEKAKKGDISVMIGPRSALFTPFEKLGLIIIDEEHESSYKSEISPKYHAREVAEWRCEMCGAALVLGSATPSLESYEKAINGRYELLTLLNRANDAVLPSISIVDMRKELKEGNRSPFSRKLLEGIARRLEKKEQVMLFLNRRGYSGFISCRSCGYVPKCPHCDISLTLHRDNRLYCHYCGYSIEKPAICPSCSSKYILGFGSGTQKIEQLVSEHFPEAKILRMDADTTSKKGDYEKILKAFRTGKADILIGTQMIVKGHDFPKVTLVGVLAADLSLYANDFRATERTYELVSQACGRAGRSELAGEAVIQTYNPEHYCIQAAAQNNYEDFFYQEISARRLLNYPPAGNLMIVLIQSESPEQNIKTGEKLSFAIKKYENLSSVKFSVIGPSEAGLKKLNDVYRSVIYIKDKNYDRLIGLKDALEFFINDQKITEATVSFDFNPLRGY